ncbi:MAG: hypothetical protein LBQ54_07890 [Planctomycetaceae bacterium]|nr:hypothetical protein [Planctomycetaceae bacterium]
MGLPSRNKDTLPLVAGINWRNNASNRLRNAVQQHAAGTKGKWLERLSIGSEPNEVSVSKPGSNARALASPLHSQKPRAALMSSKSRRW